MIIREAMDGDEIGLAEVHVDTWLSTYKGLVSDLFLDQLDYQVSAQKWKDIIAENSHILLVAEDDEGKIVGYAFGGDNRAGDAIYDGELYALYILNSSQRKGVGKLLVKSFTKRLMDEGFKSLIIWVLKGNPNYQFYENLGGQKNGEKIITIDGINYTEIAYTWDNLNHFGL